MKRGLCLLLSAAVAVTASGCGSSSAGEVSFTASSTTAATAVSDTEVKGRWVEQQVELGGMYCAFYAPVRLNDGTLVYYAQDCDENYNIWAIDDSRMHRFTSTDNGASWSMSEVDWYDIFPGDLNVACISPEGQVLVEGAHNDSKGSADYLLQAADGKTVRLSLADGGHTLPVAKYAAFIDENTLAMTDLVETGEGQPPTQQLAIYDIDGDKLSLRTLADSEGELICAMTVDTGLEYLAYNADSIDLMLMDKNGGERMLKSGVFATYSVPDTAADGSLYWANGNGVYRTAAGGTISEQLFSATGRVLGIAHASGMTVAENGDILINYYAQSYAGKTMGGLYRYYWDAEYTAADNTTITVWSLENSDTIRAAIFEMGRQNPDITINYTAAMTENTAQTKADAVKALNAELLAGQGPDVIIFDGIDPAPFAENNLLADISEVYGQNDLAGNITAPYINPDGSCYALPARFGVPVLVGDVQDMQGIASLADMQAAVLASPPRPDCDCTMEAYYTTLEGDSDERYALSLLTVEQLLDFVMDTSATALLNGDNTVNRSAVSDILSFVKAVGDYYGMKDYRPADEQQPNGITVSTLSGDAASFYDNIVEYEQTARARYGWTTMLTAGLISGASRVKGGYGGISGAEAEEKIRPDYTVALRPGLVQGAYTPICIAGVNAASGEQAAAMEFLNTLFGDNVQSTYTEDGMPVGSAALAAMLERNTLTGSGYTGDTAELLQQCKTPVTRNDEVYAAMLTHAEALVADSEELDAAVDGVCSDLALYLAERQ